MPDRLLGEDHVNGLSHGFPWWVRAIAVIGLPSVLTMALTWFLAAQVLVPLTAIAAQQLDVARKLAESDFMLRAHYLAVDEQGRSLKELERYLQQICLNTAEDRAARAQCVK